MTRRSLGGVAQAVAGRLVPAAAAGRPVHAVQIDSRTVHHGDLFVALPGEHGDGHDFAARAVASGAVGVLVREDRWAGSVAPAVLVRDPGAALLALAAAHRADLPATVVGITGSTGKTCTKDLTAAVLRGTFDVVASEASFNNEVGLPLTVLRATGETGALVCEMGARGPGHIGLLCRVARPTVGVVTNVGVAHLGLFGSAEALRNAKAELPEALPAGGTVVLNADDPVVRGFAARTAATPVLFGTGADVRAEGLTIRRRSGCAAFELSVPGGDHAPVELAVAGEHMVPNALAAAAVGWSLGIPVQEIAERLSAATVSAGRMEVFETSSGIRVVNDAYNANPVSMTAALRAARWMATGGRSIAVLGQMAELGPIADQEHERIGELLARLGIDALITVGEEARLIAVGAEREGVEPERIVRSVDAEAAIAAVRGLAAPGDLVLVKGSRVAGLERVAESLRADLAEAAPPGAVAGGYPPGSEAA